MSALKPGRDGTAVVRVYEASGRPARAVKIQFATGIQKATEVNLIEDPGAAVAVSDGSIAFDLRPWEIRTFRLSLPARQQ